VERAWALVVFGDHLYAGVGNGDTGAEVWRTGFLVDLPVVQRN
jgi:hypothetical protein